jgi:hypothetical protein
MFPPKLSDSLHSTEILFCVPARVILVIFFFNVKIWSVVDPPWYLPIGISKKSISKYMNSNFIFFSAESPNAEILANSSSKNHKNLPHPVFMFLLPETKNVDESKQLQLSNAIDLFSHMHQVQTPRANFTSLTLTNRPFTTRILISVINPRPISEFGEFTDSYLEECSMSN